MSELHQRELRSQIHYDPITGVFKWLESKQGRRKGVEAGTLNPAGYRLIRFRGKQQMAHKLAWLYVHGFIPDEVDHKDRNKSNNAIDNLRLATRGQNNINSKVRCDNSIGIKGVVFHAETGKWRARINKDGKGISLGLYVTKEAAGAAYMQARASLYGEFAP